jgi:hypothetical protein
MKLKDTNLKSHNKCIDRKFSDIHILLISTIRSQVDDKIWDTIAKIDRNTFSRYEMYKDK